MPWPANQPRRSRMSERVKLILPIARRMSSELLHPIFLGLNLLALGTAIWAPTVLTWAGFALVVLGSDLRARSEEALLLGVFGPVYADYCRRTKRFVPGLY